MAEISMWFVRYQYSVPNGKRYGSSSAGWIMDGADYFQNSDVIDIHPLEWIKNWPNYKLLDWKKLSPEDVEAYQKANPVKV